MKTLFLFIFLINYTIFAAELNLSKTKSLKYTLPEAFSHQYIRPPLPSIPAQSNITGPNVIMRVTPVPLKVSMIKDKEDLKQYVAISSIKFHQKDQEIIYKELTNYQSYFADFAIPDDIKEKQDGWNYMSLGYLVHKDVVLSYIVYSKEIDSLSYQQCLKILEELTFTDKSLSPVI